MNMAADTVDDVLAGRPAHFSWRLLAEGKPAEPRDLRRFIQVQPVLDFAAVEPGRAASEAIQDGGNAGSISPGPIRRGCG